jgi:hypothetical protein
VVAVGAGVLVGEDAAVVVDPVVPVLVACVKGVVAAAEVPALEPDESQAVAITARIAKGIYRLWCRLNFIEYYLHDGD